MIARDSVWSGVDRVTLGNVLDASHRGGYSAADLRAFVNRALIGNDPEYEIRDDEADLIQEALYLLDGALHAPDGEMSIRIMGQLFCSDLTNNTVRDLLPLVSDRVVASELLQKYGAGAVTRTQYLSFLATRDWPRNLRDAFKRVRSIDASEVAELIGTGQLGLLAGLLSL